MTTPAAGEHTPRRPPTASEIRAVSDHIATVYRRSRHPLVEGAAAAIVWLSGQEPRAPIRDQPIPPTREEITEEIRSAKLVATGVRDEHLSQYAAGAGRVLRWALGEIHLPPVLVPPAEQKAS